MAGSTAWIAVSIFCIMLVSGFCYFIMNTFMGVFFDAGTSLGTMDLDALSMFWIYAPLVVIVAIVVYAIASSVNRPDDY